MKKKMYVLRYKVNSEVREIEILSTSAMSVKLTFMGLFDDCVTIISVEEKS